MEGGKDDTRQVPALNSLHLPFPIRDQTWVIRGALIETACDPQDSDELPGQKLGYEVELPGGTGHIP